MSISCRAQQKTQDALLPSINSQLSLFNQCKFQLYQLFSYSLSELLHPEMTGHLRSRRIISISKWLVVMASKSL